MDTPRPSPRTNRTRRVHYSQEKEGDKEIRCPVHMDILWARCYGLRAHVERARELQKLAPEEVYTPPRLVLSGHAASLTPY